jgi:cytochrome c biogenesis protein CcmG/thiol:disulfide interchange protein DsbE
MLKRFVILVAILAVTIAYALYQKRALESQLVDGKQETTILGNLPASTFKDLDGNAVSLNGFYQDTPPDLLIVHFWGTWCGPCEAELPELLSLIKRFEARPGVKFLLVAVDDELIKVKKHIRTLAPNKAIWLLDNSKAHRFDFGTTRVPETFVFSSDMRTLKKYVGPQEWNKELFFQSFDEFIQISSSKL